MKETQEDHESPEKQVTKTPEKKIDTFDDVRASDKSDRIDTFDNIRISGSDSSVKTFDDIRNTKETGDKTTKIEGTEKTAIDAPESLEQKTMDQAVDNIKKNDWMQPEKWKTLSNNEKRIALEHSGKALRDAYNSPDPPLYTEKTKPNELGSYGDGYSYDAKSDKIVGSDYGIKMNEEGIKERDRKLLGDDPKAALETYSHEFRHSYQSEQAHAYDKGFKVDDPEKARKWSENLTNYKQPPEAELAKTEPERYYKEYEAYINQPVEKDAREFGEKLSKSIYTTDKVQKDK